MTPSEQATAKRAAALAWIFALSFATIGGMNANPWLVFGAVILGVVREEYL